MTEDEHIDPEASASSWCEVDVEALHHNIAFVHRGVPAQSRLGVVVKSNAYGHGMLLCARAFMAAGADWLVVNSAPEAAALREAGLEAPVYICGNVPPALAGLVAQSRARAVLTDLETARALAHAGRQWGVEVGAHIKLETGMHRQGVPLNEALELAARLRELEGIRLEGLTTHYADSDDAADHAYAAGQLQRLTEARAALAARGLEVEMVHSANSAAALLWPGAHGDLVRVGVAAYGLWPSVATRAALAERHRDDDPVAVGLRPALSWRARVAQVKEVPTGGYVGYGRSFRAPRPMRVAVLPVGYFEGYDRRLSNLAYALVDGERAPVCGRVCMNMTTADVTHIRGARAGATTTLLGRDGNDEVSADQWAAWMSTINYEVVTRIHPDQPRRLMPRDGPPGTAANDRRAR